MSKDNLPYQPWIPDQLAKWEFSLLENFYPNAERDLKRFLWLIDFLEAQFSTRLVLEKIKSGGHILDVAAGYGEPAMGILLELQTKFGLSKTKYLMTDIADRSDDLPGHEDNIAAHLMVSSKNVIEIPSSINTQNTESQAILSQKSWSQIRPRILKGYGEKWDATKPSFFDNAKELFSGDEMGLILLRHPEIGDIRQPELYPIFQSIILNILNFALETNTPILITTSNNDLSHHRIKKILSDYFAQFSEKIQGKWQIITGELPVEVQLKFEHIDGEVPKKQKMNEWGSFDSTSISNLKAQSYQKYIKDFRFFAIFPV